MKKLFILLFLVIGIVSIVPEINAQEFREHISKEFALMGDAAENTLFIYNISGLLKVEGYSGNKVLFEIDKTLSADNDRILETGKREFKLGYEQISDSIFVYIAEPFDSRPNRNRLYYNDDQVIEYHFNVDFTVKVPYNINLRISTINNGAISVRNVTGRLHLSNVNRGISVTGAKNTTYINTVNGDISVSYLKNPPEQSSYRTINGNINISYQPDLSADFQFKSMHGDFFTDFPAAESLPGVVRKSREIKDGEMVYKLNTGTCVRFGKGGRIFKFETINGNVYIKKQS
jgi:hypothetical protein